MKKLLLGFSGAILIALTGCTQKLAERKLGPEEQAWNDYLKKMYPGWNSPATLPPAVRSGNHMVRPFEDIDKVEIEEIDIVVNDPMTPEPVVPVEEKQYDDYVVQKNDSLSRIAKKVYGNGRKYQRILKANADIIKNPNKLYPGMKIRIPR